ncbi:MAG: hypothetical protein ACOC00_05705 [Halothiobacillaceae bacterium]
MQDLSIVNSGEMTMSSREIASLTRSITPLITGKGLAKIQRPWAEAYAEEVA